MSEETIKVPFDLTHPDSQENGTGTRKGWFDVRNNDPAATAAVEVFLNGKSQDTVPAGQSGGGWTFKAGDKVKLETTETGRAKGETHYHAEA
ncbi:hypothetical protein ACTL6U_07300 [Rhodovibrionaceae bacterium A322]